MATKVKLDITSDLAPGTLDSYFVSSDNRTGIQNISSFMDGLGGGSYAATIVATVYSANPAQATGTFTSASVAVDNTAVVEATTVTAKDGKEATTVTCVADVAGSLNDTYWTFSAPASNAAAETDFYVWYNVDDGGTDPEVPSATGIEVAIDADATDAQVAEATAVAITAAASAFVTAVDTAEDIALRNKFYGTATNAANGAADPGFSFAVTNAGANLSATQFQIGDTDALTATALAACLTAQAALTPLVTATANLAVVTITAVDTGNEGNFINISATGNITASGVRLTGGTDGTASQTKTYTIGR